MLTGGFTQVAPTVGTMTSAYAPSPGPFKSKDADPEATLELFEDYLETMERVFRLSRRINPATGQRIDFDNDEKKDMIIVEGGQDMGDLFKHVGKVAAGDDDHLPPLQPPLDHLCHYLLQALLF